MENFATEPLNFSFAFGGNNSGVLLSSLDSPLETFPAEENLKMAILSSVGSIQDGKESVVQYEEISSSFNDFKAMRFKGAVPPKTINPAQFRKMDDFSKFYTKIDFLENFATEPNKLKCKF